MVLPGWLEAYVSDALGHAWQLVRAVFRRLLMSGSALRALIDRRTRSDPELEHLAERAFGELRQGPLFRPSRDLVECVKQRLQQRAGGPPPPPTDEASANQD
jgi:hypothetical protein